MKKLGFCVVFGLLVCSQLCETVEASSFQIFNPFNLFQQASQSVRRMTQLFKTNNGEPSDEYVVDDEDYDVDMADRVASLVSNSLGNKSGQNKNQKTQQKTQEQQSSGPGLFGGFMRLLGLDSSRLGAIAVNAFIYISEMIAASLTNRQASRTGMWKGWARDAKDAEEPEGTPFSWLLDNVSPKISEALKLAQDPVLPELLISLLKGRSKRSLDALTNEGPTHCLQRLMCQVAPVLHGMQKTVSRAIDLTKTQNHATAPEEDKSPMTTLWRFMPTREDLVKQSDVCEAEYPQCKLYDY
ncbi:uncharacterized protein LOC132201820 [Neocloeon triangulifer]|uniref:uncharacterized protein LOC132201820 n=1 Tax=Neocloeon triangulifer TaxID=2078957 RepID=UPI00286EDF4F|nr:uncharacterized protein LOC132201820 [Neocloeon triangulifer]